MMMAFVLQSGSKVSGSAQMLFCHIFPSPANLIPSQFPCNYDVENAHIQGHTCLFKCEAYFGSVL